MADPFFFPDVAQHAPAVKHVAKHAAHVVTHAAPIIKQGFSMLTLLVSNVLSAAVAGGACWYIRGRGVNGVKVDLDNAKKEIEKLTGQSQPASAA